MVKRLIDCNSTELCKLSKPEILSAILLSEGRVMVAEVIGAVQPQLPNISNAELACAFGADILLLNCLDLEHPVCYGLENPHGDGIIHEIKRLTGRLVGVNLEPAPEVAQLPPGRIASAVTAKKALELGADAIVLTGNPATSVANKGILQGIREIKAIVGEQLIIIAGKMHGAGITGELGAKIITKHDIAEFIAAGCDIILLPAPGTIPGMTVETVRPLIDYAHSLGALAMTAVGTSQEGADEQTIRQIALMAKMAGPDLHHLGDSGLSGVAIPENIMNYGIAIRGRRHTFSRMARSINR